MSEPPNTPLHTWIKPSTYRRLQAYIQQEHSSESVVAEVAISNFLDLMELPPLVSHRRHPGRRASDAPPPQPTIKKHLDLSYDIAEEVRQKALEMETDFTDITNQALAEWLIRHK